ncbi:hypothetical protein L1987_13853 [Smallanthus sonchifolius]|uniref:Uncharacterized protein n=1 Tax=Smallanthus sonchifolius TaxID=185202 RepID=A0ACB9JHK8_9ASTR|nr:hypothetical protein L1987_13853 [Smallanthus sonchifolius]
MKRVMRTYQVRMKKIESDVVGPCLAQPKLAYKGPMWLANCCTTGAMTVAKGIMVILEVWYDLPYWVVVLEVWLFSQYVTFGFDGYEKAQIRYVKAGYDDGSVHGAEQTQVEEQPFTFEPEVRAAIAREFSELMKASLPGLLAEAMKKVNETGGSNTAVGTPNTEAINAPLNRGCDYKSFKACDPPVLTGKKDAVATFDWVIRMEAAIRLSECRTDQVVKFAANSLREEASDW